jgi:hypothetical protein
MPESSARTTHASTSSARFAPHVFDPDVGQLKVSLPDPIAVSIVLRDGWRKHISLTHLTDEACSIRKYTASLNSDTFTLLDNQLVKVSPSLDSNDELAMTLGPWVEAARRFVRMLRTSLNAGSPQNVAQIASAWEQHFINIQTQPNLQDNFSSIWLPYDITLCKTYICPGQNFNPAVIQRNILDMVERDSINCQAAETRKLLQAAITVSSSSGASRGKPSQSVTSGTGSRVANTRKQPKTDTAKWCFLCKSTEHGARQCKTPLYLRLHEGRWAKPDGTKICYPFNGVSGCQNTSGSCTYEHACSLCGEAHRARDCVA